MANLFSVANNIRKEAGYNNMTQKEAIEIAKQRLANPKPVELKIGMMLKTESGHDAKIICFTRGQMLVKIFSGKASYLDREMKYNMDGTSPFASDLNGLRLIIPTAA